MLSAVPDLPTRMWHVTLTVSGVAVSEAEIRVGLERLGHEHPFLLAGRYAADRAEVRYWDEAADAAMATEHALALWRVHRDTARLPDWSVVGVEVVDQATFHRRGRASVAAGRVLPF